MTRSTNSQRFKKLLHARRMNILSTTAKMQDELTSLKNQERDPEFEEAAQSELADYTLSRLMETQRRELRMIADALTRIEQGIFGTCIDCGEVIAAERLEAMPFALRCEEDATQHEHETLGGGFAMPSL